MAAFTGQFELAVDIPIEHRPERDQLLDPKRSLVDQHSHGFGVTQSRAGGQRVGEVEIGRVGIAIQHRGHAALSPSGRRLRERTFGEHTNPHPVSFRGPHRGRQPCHARAEHQQIELGVAIGVSPCSLPVGRWAVGELGVRSGRAAIDVAARSRTIKGGQGRRRLRVDQLIARIDVDDRRLVVLQSASE